MQDKSKQIFDDTQIYICGQTYTIQLSNNACHFYNDACNLTEKRINGFIDYAPQKITINSEISFSHQIATLLHELCHAIFKFYDVQTVFNVQEDEEIICDTIGAGMLSFLINNKPLMERILKEL